MFHTSDNLFFGRLPNGSVRIVLFREPPKEWPQVGDAFDAANVVMDRTLDDGTWGSVVATVSQGGEQDGRWYTAMDFHHGRNNGNASRG